MDKQASQPGRGRWLGRDRWGKALSQLQFRRGLEGGARDKQRNAVPFNSAFRRLRQEDQTFRDNLNNAMRPYRT